MVHLPRFAALHNNSDTSACMLIYEVVMHGANRLYFSPPELATVEDFNTDADFLNAGEGQMTMQSGSERMTIDVNVLEAPKR